MRDLDKNLKDFHCRPQEGSGNETSHSSANESVGRNEVREWLGNFIRSRETLKCHLQPVHPGPPTAGYNMPK